MGIDLRRVEIFVAKKFLHRSNVGMVVEHMGRKRVPQGVRHRRLCDTAHRNGFPHCFRERPLVNVMPPNRTAARIP